MYMMRSNTFCGVDVGELQNATVMNIDQTVDVHCRLVMNINQNVDVHYRLVMNINQNVDVHYRSVMSIGILVDVHYLCNEHRPKC